MTRLSDAELKRLGVKMAGETNPRGGSKNKYKNKKIELDGITFDSQKEAKRYSELKLLKLAGEVEEFELQPSFELNPGFRDKNGKWHRPIVYRADFWVTYPDGRQVVIDIKASKDFQTKEYRIKKKLLLYKYPELVFQEEY